MKKGKKTNAKRQTDKSICLYRLHRNRVRQRHRRQGEIIHTRQHRGRHFAEQRLRHALAYRRHLLVRRLVPASAVVHVWMMSFWVLAGAFCQVCSGSVEDQPQSTVFVLKAQVCDRQWAKRLVQRYHGHGLV